MSRRTHKTLSQKESESLRRELPEDEALPCPFCGEPPIIQYWHGGPPTKRSIDCQSENCPIHPSACAHTEQQTLDDWNMRGGRDSPFGPKGGE